MTDSVQTLTIGELFAPDGKPARYVIPIYQRNYAWAQAEIDQLIQDIYDYSTDYLNNDYFIGSLIVYERRNEGEKAYETIDGQQRLTTLILLMSALQREYKEYLPSSALNLSLRFDSRKKSTLTLDRITNFKQDLTYDLNVDYNPNIQEGYEDIVKQLRRLLSKDEREMRPFYDYLIHKVKILRVSVPHDTDLNHYFEIMNTRGEQLEKHEILKAKMIEYLQDEPLLTTAFHKIWEAAADMERYVQYGFAVDERDNIFGKDWNQIIPDNLDELAVLLANESQGNKQPQKESHRLSLSQIITYSGSFDAKEDSKEDAPERFNSVISFPNFLLHVLRIQTEEDIPLDDKRLIPYFLKILESLENDHERKRFVKNFAINLLKLKFLFDQYIIKREFYKERDGWSLKRLKRYEGSKANYLLTFEDQEDLNKEILMLLAMFHVSAPTQIYKHWLNGALYFCYNNFRAMNAESYKKYLNNLARAFFYDRYLAKKKDIDFYEIIYSNDGVSKNINEPQRQDWSLLDKGTQVENFIFNYLDFLLWQQKLGNHSTFEFAFRSSVEHYYPQNPKAGGKIRAEICDMFGNICLISRSKNSALSNYLPEAKKDHYRKVKPDSLKQQLMMEEKIWDENRILIATREMKEALKKLSPRDL